MVTVIKYLLSSLIFHISKRPTQIIRANDNFVLVKFDRKFVLCCVLWTKADERIIYKITIFDYNCSPILMGQRVLGRRY